MGILSVATVTKPFYNVKVDRFIWDLVAVEHVWNDCSVARIGKAVGHQLAVLKDAKDIAEIDYATPGLSLLAASTGGVAKYAVVLPSSSVIISPRGDPLASIR